MTLREPKEGVFASSDMVAQHPLLEEVARLVDAGTIRATASEVIGRIDAANLRQPHAQIESGRVLGKRPKETAIMPYYSVFAVTPISNDWIPSYIGPANQLVAQRGGKYLARTAHPERLEGEGERPKDEQGDAPHAAFPCWSSAAVLRIKSTAAVIRPRWVGQAWMTGTFSFLAEPRVYGRPARDRILPHSPDIA